MAMHGAMVATAPRGKRTPKLREIRLLRCWSQKHLAQIAGISAQAIVRAERGNVIAFETITQLAAALNVTPGDLTADGEAS